MHPITSHQTMTAFDNAYAEQARLEMLCQHALSSLTTIASDPYLPHGEAYKIANETLNKIMGIRYAA